MQLSSKLFSTTVEKKVKIRTLDYPTESLVDYDGVYFISTLWILEVKLIWCVAEEKYRSMSSMDERACHKESALYSIARTSVQATAVEIPLSRTSSPAYSTNKYPPVGLQTLGNGDMKLKLEKTEM